MKILASEPGSKQSDGPEMFFFLFQNSLIKTFWFISRLNHFCFILNLGRLALHPPLSDTGSGLPVGMRQKRDGSCMGSSLSMSFLVDILVGNWKRLFQEMLSRSMDK